MPGVQLQEAIDSLARRVGRAALVEDQRHRVVAYTEHTERTDEMRRLSILRLRRPDGAVEWLGSQGAYEARSPVRTPGCPRLRMRPRVCVPIRQGAALLGVLSFVDSAARGERAMTADAIAQAATVAADLAPLLHHERLAAEYTSLRETETVRDLLLGPDDARASAARSLVEDGYIRPQAAVTAIVGQVIQGTRPDTDESAALAMALEATRRWHGARECLHLARYDHGVLLVTGTSARECALRLRAQLRAALGDRGGDAMIGVGQTRERLADAASSYEEALRACRVGAILPGDERITHWSDLGIYRVLSSLVTDGSMADSVHPRVEELFADDRKLPLLETLEAFLDHAGNVHATAERLHLHRATLYYRLERIEELAAVNLKDGNERLCLHLALKMGRLTGRYRGR